MISPTQHIYLDYHATTPVDSRVADRIYHYMTAEFGNASSSDHEWGDRANASVKQVANHIANRIGSSSQHMIWTSGATESLDLS